MGYKSNWSKQQRAIYDKGDWTPHTVMAQATVLKKLIVRPPEDTQYLPPVIRSGVSIKIWCNKKGSKAISESEQE